MVAGLHHHHGLRQVRFTSVLDTTLIGINESPAGERSAIRTEVGHHERNVHYARRLNGPITFLTAEAHHPITRMQPEEFEWDGRHIVEDQWLIGHGRTALANSLHGPARG